MWSERGNSSHEPTTPVDAVLARLAAPQHGMVTRDQLLSAGLNADVIEYRIKVGRLIGVHRGVYAVGHLPPSPHARAMAAVLACGPHALLSHRSAGALYGLIRHTGPIDVTAPTSHAHKGISLHRSRTTERTLHYGIPVTTPARTLLDLADLLDATALTRAVNDARLRRLVTDHDLTTLIDQSPGRNTTA